MSIKPASDPGSLSVRVRVLERTITSDALGGGTPLFTERHGLWATFEPDGPALRSSGPVADTLATGRLTVRLGKAPAIGWRVAWVQAGIARVAEIVAVEPGRADYPFDVCTVREMAS